MVDFPERLLKGASDSIFMAPFMAACGFLGGFVYAKIADTSPTKTALYWAIYAAASNALRNIALCCTENGRVNAFINAALTGITGAYFLREMRKHELMGNKMLIFMAALHTIAVLALIGQSVEKEAQDANRKAKG